jgi:hypothetical protein
MCGRRGPGEPGVPVCISGTGIIRCFGRFCQGCFPIDIFITGDLDNSVIIAGFFQFNYSNVLAFLVGHQGLNNKQLYLVLFFVNNTEVVDVAIFVQVQVIDFIGFCIKQFLKFFRRVRLFEEGEGALQTEIVSGQSGGILVRRRPAGLVPFVRLFLQLLS